MSTCDASDFVQGQCALGIKSYKSMTTLPLSDRKFVPELYKSHLMICGALFVLRLDVVRLPFGAHDDAVFCPFIMLQFDMLGTFL